MPTKDNDPDDPNSALSRLARRVHFLTGGGKGRPNTWRSFEKMVRQRNQIRKAEEEWDRRKEEALRAYVAEWGSPGLLGRLKGEPRPKGSRLLAWYGGNGGGRGSGGETRADDGEEEAEEASAEEEAAAGAMAGG